MRFSNRSLRVIEHGLSARAFIEQPWPRPEVRKALAARATVTDIAEAEGIGRTLASREANSPECRQLIAEFVGDHEMLVLFIDRCASSSRG